MKRKNILVLLAFNAREDLIIIDNKGMLFIVDIVTESIKVVFI